jgi:hypothetical protein
MYTWSDQFENGITVDMLFTPGGVLVCVLIPLILIAGIMLQRYTARAIDDFIDTLP